MCLRVRQLLIRRRLVQKGGSRASIRARCAWYFRRSGSDALELKSDDATSSRIPLPITHSRSWQRQRFTLAAARSTLNPRLPCQASPGLQTIYPKCRTQTQPAPSLFGDAGGQTFKPEVRVTDLPRHKSGLELRRGWQRPINALGARSAGGRRDVVNWPGACGRMRWGGGARCAPGPVASSGNFTRFGGSQTPVRSLAPVQVGRGACRGHRGPG